MNFSFFGSFIPFAILIILVIGRFTHHVSLFVRITLFFLVVEENGHTSFVIHTSRCLSMSTCIFLVICELLA